ncbi:MAG: HNH endonuclease, partial [Mesorhizobium sp.]
MTKITYPSAEFLRSILRYDPETGEFWWRHRADRKNPWNARYAGKPAGRFTKSGYREITISRRLLQANRIAWIMVHGDIATDLDIDHEDGDPSNNRIKNLRPATRSQNMWNCALPA